MFRVLHEAGKERKVSVQGPLTLLEHGYLLNQLLRTVTENLVLYDIYQDLRQNL